MRPGSVPDHAVAAATALIEGLAEQGLDPHGDTLEDTAAGLAEYEVERNGDRHPENQRMERRYSGEEYDTVIDLEDEDR